MIDGLTDKTFRMPIQRIIAPTEVKSGFGSEAPHRLEYWQVSGESPYPVQERYGFANAAGPLIFYFGGIPVMSNQQAPDPAIRAEIHRYYSKQFEASDYALMIVTEKSITHGEKYALAEKYNQTPLTYASAAAEEFVNKALLPLVEDATSVDEIKRRFSCVNLIGHSYGTVFIQTVSNALYEALGRRTQLSAEEKRAAMASIRALNIGPTCAIVRKPADFTQVFITASQDKTAEGVDYERLVNDSHPVLGHRKIGDSALLLVSKNMGSQALAVRQREKTFEDATQEDEGAHSLRLYMNVNHKPRAGLKAFQVNAAAQLARDFLHDGLKSSQQAITRQEPRAGAEILDTIIAQKLTPEAKDILGARLSRNREIHGDFAGTTRER